MREIGSGQYGTVILESENSKDVVKIHVLSPEEQECPINIKREYEMMTGIFKSCDIPLKTLYGKIVQPIEFSITTRLEKKEEKNVKIPLDCRVRMERIYGRGDGIKWFQQEFEKKLRTLLKPEALPLIKRGPPPYLNLGHAIEGWEDEKGHITLGMLKYATKIPLIGNTFYYRVEKLSEQLMINMFLSFFVILLNGFIPRDIEYVFNGKPIERKSLTYFAILDFNQVVGIEERKKFADIFLKRTNENRSYNFEDDIAHVYKDLSSLAEQGTNNPYVGEEATPQWKFLCNPIVCPSTFILSCIMAANGFLEGKIARKTFASIGFNFSQFINKITDYLLKYYVTSRTQPRGLQQAEWPFFEWQPTETMFHPPNITSLLDTMNVYFRNNNRKGEFIDAIKRFDYTIQKILILKSLSSLKRSKRDQGIATLYDLIRGKNFETAIQSLNEFNNQEEAPPPVRVGNKTAPNTPVSLSPLAGEEAGTGLFNNWGGGKRKRTYKKGKGKKRVTRKH